ncbi:inositol monophosphatase family protein [Virgibacillus sp. YIM 98842]|jgi:myo-inositol-1(or 4)-monophosphatase|uniref:inositol monophosphatase family protein n=1 Tax=Virgibacillus sp. YIM 98842 TaxID=2663533 RepID=UPI0013D8F2BD|nr:inositol monophosphatase family protein [Virgibacillus sp. YIM 98842]
MEKDIRKNIYNFAKSWVLEAGKIIRKKMNDPLTIETKSHANDLVTAIDRDTESFFVNKIKSVYPNHQIIGEEGYGDEVTHLDGTVWIIDPIDGTMNFVHQKRNFAISVGIYQDGIGEIGFIYNVMEDVLYSAKRNEGAYKNHQKLPSKKAYVPLNQAILGLNHLWLCENRLVDVSAMQKLIKTVRGSRTYGSAALELAYVAEGTLDGYLTMRLAPWDIAAGKIIVEETGGVMTNVDGDEINMLGNNSIFVCNPSIQRVILDDYIKAGRK